MTQLDAWGRDVETLGTCERCGAAIKYIYIHEGRTYGSTCIEAVSGIRPDNWVWVDGKANEKATHKSLVEKEAIRLEYIAKNKALDELREGIREQNRQTYEELINLLESSRGDFCVDMARTIKTDGFSTDLYKGILSPRQFEIVREVWGKYDGRKNSKAYKAAIAEFDTKFDPKGLGAE